MKNPDSLAEEKRNRPGPGDGYPFEALHREMNRLFDGFLRQFGGPGLPRCGGTGRGAGLAEVRGGRDGRAVQVTAELPGLDEKDIQVSLDDNAHRVQGREAGAGGEAEKLLGA